jgi:ABC-type transport system substrate-binding protein
LDWELDPSLVEKYWSDEPTDPWANIVLDPLQGFDMTEFDINNNETIATHPDYTSPTHYIEFRQALAHLADKDRYVAEVYLGYANVLDRGPMWPHNVAYYNDTAKIYAYSRDLASQVLYDAGWKDAPTAASPVHYPPGHEREGEAIDPLIFYARADKDKWKACADIFKADIEAIVIPVTY